MDTTTVPEILSRTRKLVEPGLHRAVDTLSMELRPLASYHLGWIDENGQETGGDQGKGIRPALAILSSEAVAQPGETGIVGAIAIELVHDFSLIHDDVIDNDTKRRHRSTVWSLFGIGQAIILGDSLNSLAQRIILDPKLIGIRTFTEGDTPNLLAAAKCLADATSAMISGQALDMAFERISEINVASCLAMEAGKTGALLGCAASIGAILAGGSESQITALERYGVELGMAFQAIDDILGIWGDPETTGKQTFSDLRQHKKTLPIAIALASPSKHVNELAKLLIADELNEFDIERAATLIEECGGKAMAQTEAKKRFESSLGVLDKVNFEPKAKDELINLAHFVIDRKF
ncbi:MAG: polyprenyl synthetase family protein [Firmicutes bacterium]|jgi:geranylgeranyl diphosphate synthase type I|nr:polyprenyl synthetase family protein [Bacillota bacterium]